MAGSNTVTVKIVGDASSLKAATSQAANEVEGLGNKAQKAGGNGTDPLGTIGKKIDINNMMAATDTIAGVGDKVIDIGKKSIESAANLSAMNSTFSQTFGDTLPYAEDQVKKLSEAYDILPNRIKPSYQSFTAMFKGLGLDTQDAADKATQAMRISANAAAFYDKSLEDSNASLSSFVKGNYEGGESIGLFANDTQMAAYAIKNNMIPATEGAKEASEKLLISQEKAQKALDTAIQKHGENSLEAREAALKLQDVQNDINAELGPQTQKWADLDEATKQAVRLDYAENMLVQAGAIDEVGKMTGQASRESGEYENQMGNMNQAIEDLYATLGEDILPTFLDLLKGGIDTVSRLAKFFSDLPEPVKTFIFVLGGLLAVFAQLAPVISAVVAIMGALSGVALAPIIGIIAGVVVAVTAAIEIFKNWGTITDWISEKWTQFTEWAGELWEGFKETLGGIWEGVKETASTVWEGTKETLGTIWDGMKETASSTWTSIKDSATEAWGTFTEVNSVMWEVIKDTSVQIWNGMKETAATTWEAMKNAVSTAWNWIKDTTSNIWNGIKQTTSNIWNGIKDTIGRVVDTVKQVVAQKWEDLKAETSRRFTAIGQVASDLWNAIKAKVVNIVQSVKDTVMQKWEDLKAETQRKFDQIKDVASRVFNTVKDAITQPVERAVDAVKRAIDRIKNFFSGLSLKMPRIKMPPMPHFSIKGGFSLNPPRVPTFGVNWYAKGGLFNKPSIIGVGEAGDEAVLPLKDKVLGRIAAGINRNIPTHDTTDGKEYYSAQTVQNNITVEWQGDIDSPDRIQELTDTIVEAITDKNRGAFA